MAENNNSTEKLEQLLNEEKQATAEQQTKQSTPLTYDNNFHELVGDECYKNIQKYNASSKQYIDAFEDYYKHLSTEEREKLKGEAKNGKDVENQALFFLSKGKEYFDNSRYGLIQKAGGLDAYLDKFEKIVLDQKEELDQMRQEMAETKMKNTILAKEKETDNPKRAYAGRTYPKKNPYHSADMDTEKADDYFVDYVLSKKEE